MSEPTPSCAVANASDIPKTAQVVGYEARWIRSHAMLRVVKPHFWFFTLLLAGSLGHAQGMLVAVPLPKVGACPSGYSTSGNYCTPGSSARFAVQKTGACPSGYSTSGAYCLAGSNARHAVPKAGSCPSGYSTSGDYCLSSK